MTQFIVRRMLVTIPVLLGIVFIVFALARLVPGDPCRAVLGERATDELCDEFIHRYGLDQPIPVQFVTYLGQLASGDLGVSIKHSEPVTELLIERLPTTIELTIFAMIFAVVVGVPLGLISAYRRNSKADVGTMVFANFGVSMPVFVLGLLLAFLFADRPQGHALRAAAVGSPEPRRGRRAAGRGLGPPGPERPAAGDPRLRVGLYIFTSLITGQWGATVDAFRHLILPAIALGTIPLAIIARITRSSLLEVARPRLRPDGPRQGPRRARRGHPPRGCATRCCRSSRSSASSSAPCCPARS